MWGRRLDAAMQLLRWTDNREHMPMVDEFEEPPPAAADAEEPPPAAAPEDPEDVEVTRDAAPSSDAPKQ